MKLKTTLNVAQANAVTICVSFRRGVYSDAAIHHGNPHLIATPVNFEHEYASGFCPGQAMHVCVLDNRLKKHTWNQGIVKLRIYPNRLFHAPRVSTSLHRKVQLDELQFFPQRNKLRLSALQRHTQKAAELFQHRVSGLYIAAHEAGNAVHGVEQEMWVQLHS